MAKDTAARRAVARYRQRMKQSGLRLVQLWVPDTRAPGFAKECRRQSRLSARSSHENHIFDELDGLRDTEGWTA